MMFQFKDFLSVVPKYRVKIFFVSWIGITDYILQKKKISQGFETDVSWNFCML